MKKDPLKEFESPLRIPEGRTGVFEIKHKILPPETPITVVSARTAIFTGQRATEVKFPYPVRHHYLKENGDVWMSDIPQEIVQHKEIIKKLHGNVLIGGLGLGFVATLVAKSKNVNKVVVIEKSAEVIKLVWKHLKLSNGIIIQDDLFHYLSTTEEKFDSAYYDIWRSDGETEFIETIMPLRLNSVGIVKDDELYCWQEEVMRGQVLNSFLLNIELGCSDILNMSYEMFESRFYGNKFFQHKYAFYNWMRKTKPTKDVAIEGAHHYCKSLGRPSWRARWKKYES